MTKDQSTSSKEALAAGIIVKLSKRPEVELHVPCQRLQRRVENLLLRAKIGSGQVNCILEQYFPKVLPDRRWIELSKDPQDHTTYTLWVRHELEVFKCSLKLPPHRATPELAAAFDTIAEEICAHGWFNKKEPPKPAVVLTTPPAPKTEAVITVKPAVVYPAETVVVVKNGHVSQRPAKPLVITPPEIAWPPRASLEKQPSPPTFMERKMDWLAEADELIAKNLTRIAELEAELEQKIAALRAEYTQKQKPFREEIADISTTRQELFVASSAKVTQPNEGSIRA
jgi:hypothetical protein